MTARNVSPARCAATRCMASRLRRRSGSKVPASSSSCRVTMTVSKLLRMSRASAIAWAPFGATARISSVRANPAHLPSTTPGLLRQIITETLTRQPQSRPLPEAWSYVLGQAMEEAQYRTKTAATASAPLAAPEIPVVHSRPSGGSAPSVRPSAPPPSAPRSAPPVSAPPASAPASSNAAIWGAVAAVAAVIAVAAVVIAVVLGHHNASTTSSAPNSYTNPPSSYAADSPAAQAPTPTTPTFATPPSALQGEDQDGDAQCAGGFALPRGYRVSPATPTGSGSFTSCAFA